MTNFKENYDISNLKFYRYGKGEKGLAGQWGHTDPNLYGHLGDQSVFSFDSNDKIFKSAGGEQSVPSEYSYKKLPTGKFAADEAHFDEIDGHYMLLDFASAITAKELGYDGIVFVGTDGNHQALDIRNHSLEELQHNYEKVKAEELFY